MPSKIEWCDETLNVTAGCTKESAGCTNCYALRMARRQIAMGNKNYAGTVDTKGHWTGKINLIPEALDKPKHWRKSRRIFVDSMSDLFHEGVPFMYIDRVFAMTAFCPQHTFLILTKRPKRMREYYEAWGFGSTAPGLPNIHLGVSVENQATADERIPWLLKTPAAVRFVSLEPSLGPTDLRPFLGKADEFGPRLDGIIMGGESGPGARPMHPDWARSVRDQCAEAGIAYYFKQWGAWRDAESDEEFDSTKRGQKLVDCRSGVIRSYLKTDDEERNDFCSMRRVGKKAAGRVLDGRTHDELPGSEP